MPTPPGPNRPTDPPQQASRPATLPVVCFALGELYGRGDVYVRRLHRMLQRHCPQPFVLYCYTDRPRKLPPAVVQRDASAWQELDRGGMRPTTRKLGLFNPAYVEFDAFLYLDLSLIIRRDMEAMLSHAFSLPEDLVIVSNWHYDGYNSSVMRIRRGPLEAIYTAFCAGETYPQRIKGDQDFIHGVVHQHGLADRVTTFPREQIVSFRLNVEASVREPAQARARLEGATIVKFHGRPKMHKAFRLRERLRLRWRELLRGHLQPVIPIEALRRDWVR